MSDYIEKNTSEEEENGGIKLSDIWTIIVLNWQWIALSAFIALCMAFVYLRYTRPVYASAMKILVKDDDNKKFNAGQMGLENMGVISNSNGFDNELEILRSTSLSTRVVKSLKLYTSYYIEGRIRKSEVYNQSPIIVDMPQDELDKLNCSIALKIIPKEKGYKVEGKVYIPRVKEPVKFEREVNELPTTLNTPAGSVTMQLDPSFDLDGRNLYAYIVPPVAAGRNCAARLSANASSKMTTVADISFVDTQIDRAQDFLEELLKGYNEDANEDKNEVARKTEEFIKERIDVIRHELDSTEINLAQYKKSNNLINLTNDAANALTTTTEYHKKQSELQIQMNIVESLIRYMNNPANALDVIPANLGLDNQNLNKLVSDYNTLVQQRKRLLKSSGENNSYVQRITAEIEEMWPSIKLSLDAMKEDLNIQKRGVDRQYSQFSGRIAATPDQERTLNNIGRQQEIKSGLYLMLLEKREENYISLASTAAKARIIDAPQYVGRVSPKSKIIWLLALILGCCFPVGVIYLRNLLRVHIEGRADIEKLTKASILADIPLAANENSADNGLVVRENSNDMMEEAFRGLRTNLRFILDSGERVITCTSSIPGEGKTFVSTNLAMSLALMGKHVIIVGLDIRKPRLVRLFGLPSNKKGLTTFLTSNDTSYELLKEQINVGVVNQNLDILPAGIIPPNPSELISREQLDIAIKHLRDHYDYVILDTPPVGLVSDTLSISRTADMTIFVCRADYTPRSCFELINSLRDEKKLPKVNLVLNGMDMKKKKYGYYYGYGKYGRYSKYGKYGLYGKYGHDSSSHSHTEK